MNEFEQVCRIKYESFSYTSDQMKLSHLSPSFNKLGIRVKKKKKNYAGNSEKPFECSQCGEKGNGVQKFKNHMAKHAQKKVQKVQKYDEVFHDKTSQIKF